MDVTSALISLLERSGPGPSRY